MKLDQHISDLLYRYDCVVVPDFGGFVANYQAARVNSRTHSFSPPGKKLSFNSHLKSNDGLLANHIVQEFGLSYEDALLSISDCVLEYQRELNKGKRILIENVGVLYQDSYNNVLFEPITNVNYLSDSFGLEKFHVSPALAEPEETKVITIKKTERRRIHPVRIAAAIAMPIFLLGSAMMFQSKQDGNYGQIQLSNLGFNKVEARYEIRNEVINLDEDYTEEIDFEALIKQAENRSFLKVEEETLIENWYIVAGCFSEESNAARFIEKLQKQGYPAKKIDQFKKLHAVAYQGFEKESDARAFLTNIKQENASGWLLKRK